MNDTEYEVLLRKAVKVFEALEIPVGFINKGTFAKKQIDSKSEATKYYFQFGLLVGIYREKMNASDYDEKYKKRANTSVMNWMYATIDRITQLNLFEDGKL